MHASDAMTAVNRLAAGRPAARVRPRARQLQPPPGRALRALAWSVLCFASIHVLLRIVDALRHGDPGVLNVFTMLEAQRVWPALATAPSAPWWSAAFALAVYGFAYAFLARPSTGAARVPPAIARRHGVTDVARRGDTNGIPLNGSTGHLPGRRPGIRVTPVAGVLALVGGLGVHMGALTLVERFVPAFPPVPDVVHAHLPYVDFGWPGELVYAAFLVAVAVTLLRDPRRPLPAVLAMLGLFYAVRGVFLFLLPIGIPPTAPPLDARFVLWPFADHAYFPGGHTGMMTVLSLSVASRAWRRAFLAVTFAFAVGTLLARTHYAADAFGGWLVGYTVVLWSRRHLVVRAREAVRVRKSSTRLRALLEQEMR